MQNIRKRTQAGQRAGRGNEPGDKANLEKLIARAMRGDKDALISLCEKNAKNVLFRVKYFMEDHIDSEDVAQEVMIRMCSGIQDLKTPWAFNVWLNKIIINETNRYLVKNSKHGVVLNIDDYTEGLEEENDDYIPQDFLIRDDVRSTVLSIVRELPERQKQTLLLHYYDGMSVTEIAETMGITKATVSVALKRARRTIKNELENIPGIAAETRKSITMVPAEMLLARILQDDTAIMEFAGDMWVQNAVAGCREYVQQSAAFTKAAPVISKKLIGLASAVAASTVILVNLPAENVPVNEIGAPYSSPVSYENAEGKVIFEGGDAAGDHINPKKATAWTNSDYGELEVHSWEISDIESGAVLDSGLGNTLEEELTGMYERGENGHYMLRFFAGDAKGDSYTIGNSFIIYVR